MDGLQEMVERQDVFTLIAVVSISGQSCQVGFPVVLLPIVFAHVAPSWCPSHLVVHVALVWPIATLYPCDQQ